MADFIPPHGRDPRKKSGFDEFYDMLDNFLDDPLSIKDLGNKDFKINVEEKEDEYVVEAELPGVKREEIGLKLEDGKLLISVERKEEKEEERKNYIYKERKHSSMKRRLHFGDVKQEDIKAKLEDGILYINISKAKDDESTEIPID